MISGNAGTVLPPQMIPKSQKNKQWGMDCMDALEKVGRVAFTDNLRLVENYEMVKGKFIYQHYIEREDYADLITHLTKEFELPSHLRHYDIISQVINTLSGEYQKRPDVFRVKGFDEQTTNNFIRRKTDLMIEWVMNELNTYIAERLAAEGLDPNKQDFSSPEEAQQYQQIIQERTNALTPPEIERYMSTTWMDEAEIWAEYQLDKDKQKYKLDEKEKIEFEDMLIADRCFRHFYITPYGYNQETWNPINTFFHKSPDIQYVENGDYVGRVFYLSIPEIINRYGHKMTEKEISILEKFKRDNYKARTATFGEQYTGFNNVIPGTIMPFADYPQYKATKELLGFDPTNPIVTPDEVMLYAINKDNSFRYDSSLIFQVTEGYWMSQEKRGKYVYPDMETGKPLVMIVDETFDPKKIPGIKVLESSFMEAGEELQLNTLTWTWVNVCYKGIKINSRFLNIDHPIYLDIGPNEFQFKGDINLYGAKLPVCGQIFNNRNSVSMSLVDLMKPHQIGYNVAMNQLYEIMQREIGRFMLMDMNFIPSGKDWGGEKNFERLMLVAKQLGIAPVDGSPSNIKGSNFAHFQPVDLDESARMISRLNIAEAFENFALKQVGITPQRLGTVLASETATGVQQAVNQSYAQTESYFTNFSNYKRRCMQMGLDIAQYVQSQEQDITVTYTKSDLSRAFLKIAGMELLLREFDVYVSNSQEVVRQLETARQFFMNNNTTNATSDDIMTVIMSNSPAEIRAQMKASTKKAQELAEQQQTVQQQMQQQQLQMQQQIEAQKQQFEAAQNDLDRANERYIAEIKAVAVGTIKTGPDADGSGVPDALEVQKFNLELDKHSEDNLLKRDQERNKQIEIQNKQDLENKKLDVEAKKMKQDREIKEKELELEKEKMKNDLEIAKYKDKGTKNSPKK